MHANHLICLIVQHKSTKKRELREISHPRPPANGKLRSNVHEAVRRPPEQAFVDRPTMPAWISYLCHGVPSKNHGTLLPNLPQRLEPRMVRPSLSSEARRPSSSTPPTVAAIFACSAGDTGFRRGLGRSTALGIGFWTIFM